MCYLNQDYTEDNWTYSCALTGGGWFGFKSAYSANTAAIFDRSNEVVGNLKFHSRLFRPHLLKVELVGKSETITVEAKFLKKLAYFPFTFELDGRSYRLDAFRGHYRILYENDIQVASFDKKKLTFFDRDTFVTRAENHLDVVLLFALSIFDDIWTSNDESTVTLDVGNVGFPKPPDNKNWKPKLTT